MTNRIVIREEGGRYSVRDARVVKVPSGNESFPYRTVEQLYWRNLPGGKPKPTPLHPYFISHQQHGSVCYECNKWRADDEHWKEIVEEIRNNPECGYINSPGEAVFPSTRDIDGNLLPESDSYLRVWTNKKFPHRDYCSIECYKKARERRRKERRERELLEKYKDLPADERPDGYCKICGRDISDKRAGALTCSDSCRKKYNRNE